MSKNKKAAPAGTTSPAATAQGSIVPAAPRLTEREKTQMDREMRERADRVRAIHLSELRGKDRAPQKVSKTTAATTRSSKLSPAAAANALIVLAAAALAADKKVRAPAILDSGCSAKGLITPADAKRAGLTPTGPSNVLISNAHGGLSKASAKAPLDTNGLSPKSGEVDIAPGLRHSLRGVSAYADEG